MSIAHNSSLVHYLNVDQNYLIELLAKQPQLWQQLQLAMVNKQQLYNSKQIIAQALTIKFNSPTNINYNDQLVQAFKHYDTLEQYSQVDQVTFWYWFAGLVDPNGHLRCTSNNKELVLTMGHQDLVLLYWLNRVLGGRVVSVANKQAYGIVFNQSNCNLKIIIEQLNGKLSHVNKITGLKQFCVNFNITYEPSNVDTLTALFFNAYVLGLFDSNGTIYVRAERQVAKFSCANSDQLWLAQRITSKSIRVCIGISGQAHLLQPLTSLALPIKHSANKPKQDGTASITSGIETYYSSASLDCTRFTTLYNSLTHYALPVPSVKQMRLALVNEFMTLQRPLMVQEPLVHSQCINWFLAWLVWPIAHKQQLFDRYIVETTKKATVL